MAARISMCVLRIAWRVALAMLLPLLLTVSLGEGGDTLPNAVSALRQVVLARLNLRLHLLAEGAIAGSYGRTCGACGGQYTRQHERRGFALYRGSDCCFESEGHTFSLSQSIALSELRAGPSLATTCARRQPPWLSTR